MAVEIISWPNQHTNHVAATPGVEPITLALADGHSYQLLYQARLNKMVDLRRNARIEHLSLSKSVIRHS